MRPAFPFIFGQIVGALLIGAVGGALINTASIESFSIIMVVAAAASATVCRWWPGYDGPWWQLWLADGPAFEIELLDEGPGQIAAFMNTVKDGTVRLVSESGRAAKPPSVASGTLNMMTKGCRKLWNSTHISRYVMMSASMSELLRVLRKPQSPSSARRTAFSRLAVPV